MKMWRRISLLLMVMMMTMIFSVSVGATFTISTSGITKPPAEMKKGSYFSVRGTLNSTEKMTKVVVTIYKGTSCVQRYEAKPYSYSYNLANADAYMLFNKLSTGSYYYRICAYNSAGTKKRILNKAFSVVGTAATSSIKISNPLPSGNITLTKGNGYTIGGKITSTYKIVAITAAIRVKSTGKACYLKTVRPGTKTYSLSTNKTLDSAMRFDKLSTGTYIFRVAVKDSKGTTKTVISRTVTVKSSSGTGGSTTPTGYQKRTSPPASTNKYYYNSSYNTYAKYNSLAPTGVAYGGVYVVGNCTWYACGRAMEIVARAGGNINKVMAIFGKDPVGIFNANKSLGYFKYGSTPKVGSLVVFNYGSNGDAHIAVVEDIVGGVPYVSESGYKVSTTPPNAAKSNIVFYYQSIHNWSGNRDILGYIYLI